MKRIVLLILFVVMILFLLFVSVVEAREVVVEGKFIYSLNPIMNISIKNARIDIWQGVFSWDFLEEKITDSEGNFNFRVNFEGEKPFSEAGTDSTDDELSCE